MMRLNDKNGTSLYINPFFFLPLLLLQLFFNERKYYIYKMSAANNNEARELALLHDPVVHDERLNEIRQKLGFIIDMENVIFKVCCVI